MILASELRGDEFYHEFMKMVEAINCASYGEYRAFVADVELPGGKGTVIIAIEVSKDDDN